MIAQLIFLIITSIAFYLAYKQFSKIRRNILLGRKIGKASYAKERWQRVLLNALGQKKMFSNPIPATLHFFVYIGFIIINIEVLEIILDGLLGTHRVFAPILGSFYTFLISSFEVLAILVIVACIIFLFRRNVIKVKRFTSPELSKFPRLDANIILFTEIVLMSAFLLLDIADLNLQSLGSVHYHTTGNFLISGAMTGLLSGINEQGLILLERIGWWAHIIGIYAFINYLPLSKHLHIILSFPNTYYSKLDAQAKMNNMPEITREVHLMLYPEAVNTEGNFDTPPSRFGAKDVTDLSFNDLLGAYSCTECGRCTAQCPANQTGKLLSPRKIMMDTRDRLEEIGKKIDKGIDIQSDENSLLGGYISSEEVLACTSCQACVEACPVNINPLDIIFQLKRYIVMDESSAPSQWNMMFTNVENNQTPWQFSPMDRDLWKNEIETKA